MKRIEAPRYSGSSYCAPFWRQWEAREIYGLTILLAKTIELDIKVSCCSVSSKLRDQYDGIDNEVDHETLAFTGLGLMFRDMTEEQREEVAQLRGFQSFAELTQLIRTTLTTMKQTYNPNPNFSITNLPRDKSLCELLVQHHDKLSEDEKGILLYQLELIQQHTPQGEPFLMNYW